jgi:hypothetical protein
MILPNLPEHPRGADTVYLKNSGELGAQRSKPEALRVETGDGAKK